ncbi:NitT/TauT family transport system substrate-binding protein [Nocardioides massiliensis]|uniref:NitT/TauT family transport system substrate-binding protein n=1 Tax=Nocardioides massiliensis TaxID=1325935 RepID=A0ABT9NL59_9ACTN|nr:ABC transporter substrate-binding protein [Nocardioides massiliensis]MDP9821154.1 NitT/TauT family transport system substrate-binding protein [Nocardioides massiliensis]
MGLLASVALAACSDDSGASNGELDEVSVTVSHWPTSGYSATYMVGQEKGFFEEEGIALEGIVPGAGGGTTVRSITSGDLDFGEVSTTGLVQATMAGAPLVGIATSAGSIADLVWVAKEDSSFDSFEDFCGDGVWGITAPGSNSEALTALMAQEAGMRPDCVNTVATGDLAAGLVLVRSGEVDASILTEPLLTTELAKGDLKPVAEAVEYLPNFIQVVTVASQKIIDEDPELVQRFVNALGASQDFIRENPEEAGAIFAEEAGVDEETGVEIMTRLAADERFFTQELTVEGLTSTINGMEVLGHYDGDPIAWDQLIDQQFLPEESRIDLSELPGYEG